MARRKPRSRGQEPRAELLEPRLLLSSDIIPFTGGDGVKGPLGVSETIGKSDAYAAMVLADGAATVDLTIQTPSNIDISGTWTITSYFGSGTVSLDASGLITGGSVLDSEGITITFAGGSAQVAADGSVSVTVETDDAQEPTNYFTGAINASGNVVVMTDTGRPVASDDEELVTMVKHTGIFSNADLNGSWGFQDPYLTGSMTFNGKGQITGGDFVDSDGGQGHITGGTYTLAADGTLTGTATVTGTVDPGPQQVAGVLNASKDILVIRNPSSAYPDDMNMLVLTRHSGTFSLADITGAWWVVSDGVNGTIISNGHGQITGGSVLNPDGTTSEITGGTYTVSSDGHVTLNPTSNDPEENQPRPMVGVLNSSKDVLTLTDANRGAADYEDEYMVFLVNSIGPDLLGQIGQVTLPELSVPGDKGKAPVTVANQGQLPAAGNITIKVYASADSTLGQDDVLVGTLANQAVNLAIGASKTFNIDVTVNSNVLPGNYYLLADIDTTNAIHENDETNNVAVTDGPGQVLWQFGQVGTRGNVSLHLSDADGTAATFTLTGSGTGEVIPGESGWDLAISGTTSASAVSITTKKTNGDDGKLDLNDITVGGSGDGVSFSESVGLSDSTSLGSLNAPTTNLLGSLGVTGSLGTLTLDDVADGHVIDIGPSDVATATVGMTFDLVRDLSIYSQTPIRSISAKEWLDSGADDLVSAPSVGTLTISGDKTRGRAGDFQAGLLLSGNANPLVPTLGSVVIAGGVGVADWDIAGRAGSISIAGAVTDLYLHGSGDGLTGLSSFSAGHVASLVAEIAGPIGTLKAKSLAAGSIHADSLTSLNITGNGQPGNFGADLTLTGAAETGTSVKVLGTASVAGAITGGTWTITGNVGSVSVGSAAQGWSATVSGDLTSLLSGGNLGGQIEARSIHTFTVRGDLDHAQVYLTQTVPAIGSSVQALGSLTVSGKMQDSILQSSGNVGTVNLGAMFNSKFHAGVKRGLETLPAGRQDFEATDDDMLLPSVGAVNIRGLAGQTVVFGGSTIAFWRMGRISVNMRNVNTSNGGVKFGLIAHSIKSYTCKVNGVATVKATNRVGGQVVEDLETDAGEFIVRLI